MRRDRLDNPHTQPSGACIHTIHLYTSPHAPVSACLTPGTGTTHHIMVKTSNRGRRVASRRLTQITDYFSPMGPVSAVERAYSCCVFLFDGGYGMCDTDNCITSNSGVCSSSYYHPGLLYLRVKMKEADDMSAWTKSLSRATATSVSGV